jgi:alcohol dehydrogenase
MNALVYRGPKDISFEQVSDPILLEPTDAIVAVSATTICGSDLHIVRGDLPEVEAGRILGHEAVGVVEQIGSAVHRLGVGDKVLVSCITSCGTCRFCRASQYGQCVGGGGWILGHNIDGTQAEKVRVPFADLSTYPVPDGVADEEFLMLADILPTAFEVGVLNGHVSPGDVVAIIGAGPIGLSAIVGVKLFSPSQIISIDLVATRLDAARRFGADVLIDNSSEDPKKVIDELTQGLGVDVAIEAVGMAATFELAAELIRPGGRLANVGVHGSPATLHLESLWTRDVTITTGLVDTSSTPVLSRLVTSHQIDPAPFITHRLRLDEIERGYELSADAATSGALKIVFTTA